MTWLSASKIRRPSTCSEAYVAVIGRNDTDIVPPVLARLRALLSPGSGPPMRELGAETGWYPLAVLFAFNLVDELDRVVLGVFAPNIKRYFDIDNTTIGALVG